MPLFTHFTDSQQECDTCLDVLQGLENIDDDAERQGIHLVKTTDTEFAEKMGIEPEEIPSLVFFNDQMPNLFDGDISAEEEVLDWLIEQKVESHIDLVTRPMLEEMIEEIQYLAVMFCEYINYHTSMLTRSSFNILDKLFTFTFYFYFSQTKLSNL